MSVTSASLGSQIATRVTIELAGVGQTRLCRRNTGRDRRKGLIDEAHIYNEDHEAFRASVRAWLEREVTPRLDDFIEAKAIPRDVWIEAGKQGFLGLEIEDEYGGSAGRRLSLQRGHERGTLPGLGRTLLVSGHPRRHRRPVPRDLCTEEQKQRWLPAFCTGEMVTAIGMTEPSGGFRSRRAEDDRRAGRRRLGAQRLQDLHHQRLLGGSGRRCSAHDTGLRRPRHQSCSA